MSEMGLGKAEDLTGRVFGRLTVTGFAGRDRRGQILWDCQCSCENEAPSKAAHRLKSGHTTSCGCAQREATAKRSTTHGMSKSVEFKVWQGVHARCSNRNSDDWPHYGGRGIAVCPEWGDFAVFYADMGARPSPDHSLDRRDNDGPYSPGNCRWATPEIQANNTSRNLLLTHLSETKTMSEWCRTLGLSYAAVQNRKMRGWSDKDALTTPVRAVREAGPLTHLGKTQSIGQWCREMGLCHVTVLKRKLRGWSDEDALTKPLRTTKRKPK